MPVLEQFRNFIRHGKAAGPSNMRPDDASPYALNQGVYTADARSRRTMEPLIVVSAAQDDPSRRETSLDFVDVGPWGPEPDVSTPTRASAVAPQLSTSALHGSGQSEASTPQDVPDDGLGCLGSGLASTPHQNSQRNRDRNRDVAEQLVHRENEERKKQAATLEYQGLTERYILLDKMGDGAFSNVYKAAHRQTGQQCAIKVVRKFELNPAGSDRLNPQFRKKNKATERANILKEVQIMRGLDHDNIVRLLEFSESSEYYFLVLELARGGELFHQIAKLTYFSEPLARHVIVQVAEAIRYMHEEAGVVHRDIKPENILYDPVPFVPSKHPIPRPYDEDKEDEGEFIPGVGGGGIGKVKIADFGLSKIVWESSTKTPCGTAGYTAPEIVKDQRYNKSVDMWALGCVLYTILCGFPPFYDESIQVLTEKVARGQYTFLSPWWDDISDSSKDLISHLLTVDPRKRYTIDQFLAHPWIREGASNRSLLPTGVPVKSFQPQARTPILDSPLLDALRADDASGQARAGMGLTTPGVHQLREAFDVTYAVHRMEEEAYHRNALAGTAGQNLMQLNEEEEEDESQHLPAAVTNVLAQKRLQHRQALQSVPQPRMHGAVAESRKPMTCNVPPKPKTGGFELNMNNATLLRNRGNRGNRNDMLRQKLALGTTVSPVPSPVV